MSRARPLHFKNNLAHDPKTDRWHVRKMVDGRVIQRAFPSKRAAQIYLDNIVLIHSGLDLEKTVPTIDDALSAYRERLELLGRGDHTILYYISKIGQIAALLGPNTPIDRITDRHIETYVRSRTAGAGTILKELRALRTITKEAGVELRWRIPPLTHHPKRRMVRTPAEVAAFWHHLNPEARPAVALCLLAGLRAEEAWRADASWCRFDQKELWVPVTKTSEWNRTALVDTLADLLPTSGPLVTTRRNRIKGHLEAASRAAGLDPPYSGPGAFRHHCATWAVDAGHTEADVQLILSHAQGSVTARYIHSQAVAQKRAVLESVEKLFLAGLAKVITPNEQNSQTEANTAQNPKPTTTTQT